MSALGHSRTNRLAPKSINVRCSPKADSSSAPLSMQGRLGLLCNRGARSWKKMTACLGAYGPKRGFVEKPRSHIFFAVIIFQASIARRINHRPWLVNSQAVRGPRLLWGLSLFLSGSMFCGVARRGCGNLFQPKYFRRNCLSGSEARFSCVCVRGHRVAPVASRFRPKLPNSFERNQTEFLSKFGSLTS
jgi:hypothetical protein